MAHLWQNDGLQKMNTFLSDLEMKKILDERREKKELARMKLLAGEMILNPNGFNKLSESDIWSRTKKEDRKINKFREDMAGYVPQRAVQRKVMSFATDTEAKMYTRLDYHTNVIDEYIDKSNYWKKNSVKITPADSNDMLRIIYASNEQMECIIFEYLKKYVISTVSSFENHLRAIEGKDLIKECVISDATVVESDYKPKIENPVKHSDVLDILKTVKDFNV